MLFSGFDEFENMEDDMFDIINGQCNGRKKGTILKGFDYIPKSVRTITLNSGFADMTLLICGPTLFDNLKGVATNFEVVCGNAKMTSHLFSHSMLVGRL